MNPEASTEEYIEVLCPYGETLRIKEEGGKIICPLHGVCVGCN